MFRKPAWKWVKGKKRNTERQRSDPDTISLASGSSDPTMPIRRSSNGYFRYWANTPSACAPCFKTKDHAELV